jgi:WhiB family redox-sensing transcriptional regulator
VASGRRHPWEWLEEAACRDVDPETFFPLGSGDLYDQLVHRAQRVCAACAVVRECAGFALHLGATDGVWAGRPASEFVERRRAPA